MRMSDWCADVCSSDLLPPAQRLPATVGLAPQEGGFPALFGAVEEHRDQAGKIVEMRVFQLHASSLLGRMSSSVPLFGRRGGIVDRPGAGAARIGGAAPAGRGAPGRLYLRPHIPAPKGLAEPRAIPRHPPAPPPHP